jgi:hypothetical protein
MEVSQAAATKAFFERLKPGKGPNPLSKLICDTYQVKQNSFEFYQLLHAQRSNLMDLHRYASSAQISNQEQKNFLNSLMNLTAAIDFGGLGNRGSDVWDRNIAPYLRDLDYLAGRLGLHRSGDDKSITDLKSLAQRLGDLKEEIRSSSVSLIEKVKIIQSIEALIFFVNHIEIVGVDRAWEKALTTLTETAIVTSKLNQNSKGVMKRGLAIISAITVALAAINGLADEIGDTKEMLMDAWEATKQVIDHEPLLVEDQTTK